MNPPKRINIRLNKADIKKDMRHALGVMSKLRKETLMNSRYSSEQREVYFHYVYNLSSQIDALMDDQMFSKLQPLTERLGASPIFSRYDPLQTCWKGKVPTFVSDLEYAALSVFREGFDETDHMYHLLQALKYIGTKEGSPEERRDFISQFYLFKIL